MRLIDADALYREYQSVVCHDISCAECKAVDKDTGECRVDYLISDAPTIDSDRPKGEWINKHEWANGFYERECSICGAMKPQLMHTAKINYCPNCGADMRGEDNE